MAKKVEITICLGSSCFSKGSKETLKLIKDFLKEKKIEDKVFFHGSLCMGRCKSGPNLSIDGKSFNNITNENVLEILESSLNELTL
jgi:NADH:ubiquinone oxidoreductase subunit E